MTYTRLTWRAALGQACRLGRVLVPGLVMLMAFVGPARAAQEPTIVVELSSPLAKLGGQVNLSIKVDQAGGVELVPPVDVPGLEISEPGRPAVTRQSMVVNGRLFEQNSTEWILRVRPVEAGLYEIPPVMVRIDGVEYVVPDEALELRVIEDEAGAEMGFIEFVDLPPRIYEGQPFQVEILFGWDQDLQLAEAKLDLPWWDGLRGVLEVDAPSFGAGKIFDLVVNERERVRVEELDPEVRGGRVMRRLRMARRLMATRSEDLDLSAGTFQFAELVERGVGFRPDRVKRYYARLAPARNQVLPVPEKGRPLTWTGAVGDLTAERRVDRRDVDEGDSLSLTVSWFGDGNLEFFEAPDLSRVEGFADFRVLGSRDDRLGDERRVTYELLPATHDITEIPPVPLWVFDTSEEEFTVVATEPVTIRVRPVADDLTGFSEAPEVERMDLRDLHTTPVRKRVADGPSGRLLALSLLGLLGGWFGLRTIVRRGGAPDSGAARRRRRARSALARGLRSATTASAQTALVAEFLAARTGETPAAWVGRDVSEWAAERASSGAVDVEALVMLLDDLDEAAYGRSDERVEPGRILSIAGELIRRGL